MGFRFKRSEGVEAGVRRIAGEQLDRSLGKLAERIGRDVGTREASGNDTPTTRDDEPPAHHTAGRHAAGRHTTGRHTAGHEAPGVDETVHSVRKRCKKLRGLLRLVRPSLGKRYRVENVRYRDAARMLSTLRDSKSICVAFDSLLEHFGREIRPEAFAPLRERLACDEASAAADRLTRHDVSDRERLLEAFAEAMREGRNGLDEWSLKREGFDAIAEGLRLTYTRGREAMSDAYATPSPESFHEWRKRVKYHGYHLRLLQPAWSPVLKRQRKAVDELADWLGDDHDLAVLRDTVTGWDGEADALPASTRETLLGLIDRRRLQIQSRAEPLGARVFAEKPSALVDRIGGYWQAWRGAADDSAG